MYKKLRAPKALKPSSSVLRAYTGGVIRNFGTTCQRVTVGKAANSGKFFVVKDGHLAILGLDASEALGIVQRRVDAIETSEEYKTTKDFWHPFEELSCPKQPYSMVLQPGATPVVQPARRVPLSLRQPLRDELQRMEQAGIIKRETPPPIGMFQGST